MSTRIEGEVAELRWRDSDLPNLRLRISRSVTLVDGVFEMGPPQHMLGHKSAGLTLDRYGHLYESDVEAVGVAMNDLLTRNCGQNVGTDVVSGPELRAVNSA